MILNFTDYNFINESKTLKEFQKININGYTYHQVFDGFKSRGYTYLGTIIIESKVTNANPCDEFTSLVPEDIFNIAIKYGKESEYLSHTPSTEQISFYISDVAYKKLLPIFKDNDVDNITACKKSGELYYTLWNKDKKYFYFLRIDSLHIKYWITGFAELWLKIRTSGIDVVRKELEDIKIECENKERERIAARERNKKIKDLQDAIRNDIKTNEDKYRDVEKYDDLPDEVKNSLENKDGVYAELTMEWRESGPYDWEHRTHYINNSDLSDGYKYNTSVTRQRYWGD